MTYSPHFKLLAAASIAAQAGVSIGPREVRAIAASHNWPMPTFEQCLDVIDGLFVVVIARAKRSAD